MNRFLSIKEMAILVTVIAHIAIYVVFFMAEIDDKLPEEQKEIYLAIQTEDELFPEEHQQAPDQAEAVEDMGEMISNQASNKNEVVEPDYDDIKVTEEDIAKTKAIYGADKWDKQGNNDQEDTQNNDGNVNITKTQGSSEDNSNPKAIKYSGKSTCEWVLEGRELWKPSNPVYRCKAGGEVFINIVVNRQGKVVKTEINPSKSSTSDECLTSQALEYVKKLVFNTNYDAATRQSGHVIYKFQLQ